MQLKFLHTNKDGTPFNDSFDRGYGVVSIIDGFVDIADEHVNDLISTGNFVRIDEISELIKSAAPAAPGKPVARAKAAKGT
jgi:hypothetical protein